MSHRDPIPATQGLAEEVRAYAQRRFGGGVYSEVGKRWFAERFQVAALVRAACQRAGPAREGPDTERMLQERERAWTVCLRGQGAPSRVERRSRLVREAWASAVQGSLREWSRVVTDVHLFYLKHGSRGLGLQCRYAIDAVVERRAEDCMRDKFLTWKKDSRLGRRLLVLDEALRIYNAGFA